MLEASPASIEHAGRSSFFVPDAFAARQPGTAGIARQNESPLAGDGVMRFRRLAGGCVDHS